MLEEILGLKRSVLRLRRISSKQLDVLYRISHGQFQLISGPVLPFYRDIYDHLVRVTDLAESYRDLQLMVVAPIALTIAQRPPTGSTRSHRDA